MGLHLAVSQLFHMFTVHFCLPDDISIEFILLALRGGGGGGGGFDQN